jgi:hypothetical protein
VLDKEGQSVRAQSKRFHIEVGGVVIPAQAGI